MGTRDLDIDDDIYADNDRRTCRARTMVSLNSTRKLYNTIEHFVNVVSWTPFASAGESLVSELVNIDMANAVL